MCNDHNLVRSKTKEKKSSRPKVLIPNYKLDVIYTLFIVEVIV